MAGRPALTRRPDTSAIARRFNRYAASYDRYAEVQRAMAEETAARARDLLPVARSVLEVGCGTGSLTELLVRSYPGAEIVAIDLAGAMIERARLRLAGLEGAARVRLEAGDVESMPLGTERYDLVVSSATVQWLGDPAGTTRRLACALWPGGVMVHATFGPDTFRELHDVFREVELEHGLEPRLHGLELWPGSRWESVLREAGVAEVEVREERRRVDYGSCLDLLASIKRTGASHTPAEARGERGRLLREVARRYDARFRAGAGVYATYHLLTLAGARAHGEERGRRDFAGPPSGSGRTII